MRARLFVRVRGRSAACMELWLGCYAGWERVGERCPRVLNRTIKWYMRLMVHYGEIVGVKSSMESIIFSSNAIKM